LLGAKSVTLSDQKSFVFPVGSGGASPERGKSLLDLLRLNVAKNECNLPPLTSVRVLEMLWGNPENIAAAKEASATYDLIVGADILLFTLAHPALVETLTALSSSSTIVIIEHTDRSEDAHSYPPDLLMFVDRLVEQGLWTPSVVRDYGRHITIRLTRQQSVGSELYAFEGLSDRVAVK
jgi:hypothetical protein